METPYTRIRLRRLVADLSREDLARIVGKDRRWIESVERGAPVSQADAERISAVFGLNVETLFTTAGKPRKEKSA